MKVQRSIEAHEYRKINIKVIRDRQSTKKVGQNHFRYTHGTFYDTLGHFQLFFIENDVIMTSPIVLEIKILCLDINSYIFNRV